MWADFALILVVFGVLIAAGMPVFLAMGISGGVGIVAIRGMDALGDVPFFAFQGLDSFVLVAVPLFVFSGTLMHEIGASKLLLDFTRTVVGRIPHALGIAVIGACALFAAISGSSVATAATIGLVALPALREQGYGPGQSGSLVAAGGTLGILIPPSISMIIYGVLTEQSVGQLFIAGLLPGIVLAALFTVTLMLVVRPAVRGTYSDVGVKLRALRAAVWTLLLPLLIIVTIYLGLATPTEVAGLAVMYVALLGFIVYRRLGFAALTRATSNGLLTSVMILMLISFGQVLTTALTLARVPQTLASQVSAFEVPPFVTFTLIILIYLVLGAVLEATSMIIVTIPIFFPISQILGIDPLVFGVIVTLAMEVAQITPPVGINLYVISGVGDIPLERLLRYATPYVLAMLAMIYFVYYVPSIATWLPTFMR